MKSRTIAAALTGAALAGGAAIPALAGGAFPALASGGAHASAVHDVVLKNISYHPATLNVKRGDVVTWLWRDGGIQHNVTGRGFKSKTMGSGSFSVRFTHSGTYNYHCTIHFRSGMVGKVVVH